ncbi:MAG: hypothetical protein IKL52_03935 [Candidatus Gastranaerophilales bacterium]|nr:hypothetical protein [Candidatus Gastranaerophilales bacterium]
MYNSIYPVNINYSNKYNQYRKNTDSTGAQQSLVDSESTPKQNNTFPNGTKVAIDYTRGQINISQVLTDFRSTIVAINAPDDIKEEVNIYLGLVEKESRKENPSREIVIANLKNASRISDSFIASALKKPSNVVEKWIETLFLQKINLKADPNEINPDFQLEFPQKAQERIDAQNASQAQSAQIETQAQTQEEFSIDEQTESADVQIEQPVAQTITISDDAVSQDAQETLIVESEFELSEKQAHSEPDNAEYTSQKSKTQTLFSPLCEADVKARELFTQAKRMPQTNQGDMNAINLLNEALGVMAGDSASNQNIKAAIHIERGKIFDSYDYVDYALRDYYEATKADDFNLKAQAHYKSGQIYDEFSEYSPAIDNYLSSVAYSAQAENADAQTRVLSKISSLYTRQYDTKNALEYGTLAIETANETDNLKLIATTYSTDAQNSQYLGEDDRALDGYKNALSIFSRNNESFEQMAYNYEQAAIVMRKLGNHSKAAKLQLKANQYYQKALLEQGQLGEVS